MREPPQRVAPPSPPGALLKRLAATSAVMRLRGMLGHEPAYLVRIRQLPCLNCGMEPCGEAAHVRMSSAAFGKRSDLSRKPADRWAVPLCAACHRDDPDSQHNVGEMNFWHRVGINPLLIAERLYAAKGDIVRMRAITLQAIAERRP